MEDNFSWTLAGRWFQDDSNALHLLCMLLLFHQLHLRSSGIRSWRLETPGLDDEPVLCLPGVRHGACLQWWNYWTESLYLTFNFLCNYNLNVICLTFCPHNIWKTCYSVYFLCYFILKFKNISFMLKRNYQFPFSLVKMSTFFPLGERKDEGCCIQFLMPIRNLNFR